MSVLGLCQELVPHVAALNNLSLATQQSNQVAETLQGCHTTTSTHTATLESDHPYKPATVVCYRYCDVCYRYCDVCCSYVVCATGTWCVVQVL